MGTLFYDDARFVLDDRLLAHLQIIISLKLRRGESFFLSWKSSESEAEGRNVIWIDNGVPLRMRFDESETPKINRAWAETLALSANTNNGLVITGESIEPADEPEA
ncbi:hypothetical protein ACFM35_10665 [Microbacterium sp. P01]|uniref:DUF7882 family protein n=1 Tax=Microbacterium sp. P01 TaxID=3366261 RepID=UPI0036727E8D